jgi:dolichol-phosphate mannosyltransferase
MDISLVVPVYKKESVILEDIMTKKEVLERMGVCYEMIYVIDGELDNSYRIINKFESKNFHIIKYKENEGKGYALRQGFARAQGDLVAYLDCDLDIDPSIIEDMFRKQIQTNSDIVYPNKFRRDSTYVTTWRRRLGSKCALLLMRWLHKVKVLDIQTGAKLYRKEVIKKILPNLVINSFAFELEIFLRAQESGYSNFVDSPVHIRQGEDYSANYEKELEFLIDIVKLRFSLFFSIR